MKQYEFLPHTADAKFRAYGKTLDEAFENSAYAMADIITDHKKIKAKIKKTINIKSENQEALLYDFLEQFLILLDSENFLLSEVTNLKIKKLGKELTLKASIIGDDHPEEYEINTSIKAVTYQEMFIKKEKEGFIIQVIVDI